MGQIHSRLQPKWSCGTKRHRGQPAELVLLLLLAFALAGCGTDSTNPDWEATMEANFAKSLPREESSGATPKVGNNGGGETGGRAATSDGQAESPGVEDSVDRDALVALYNATGGPSWRDNRYWLSDRPIVEWSGVRTSSGRVTALHLFQNQMSGELPPELGTLTHLEYLYLWENALVGEIPYQLGNLSELRELNVRGNKLSGAIPPELGKLASLTHLDLNSNRLSGNIPLELGKLESLSTMNLWNNRLSGQIPAELGNLKSLHTLSLASNQLSGGIPPELGNAEFLNYLDLEDNRLSGEIPPKLGEARELRLLWLSGNEISGEMPVELANRRHLDLSGSATGCIPRGLRNVQYDRPPEEPRIVVVDRTSDAAKLHADGESVDAFSGKLLTQQPIWYEWRRSDAGASGPFNLTNSNVKTKEYVNRGLGPDMTYYYTARACNACGCSDFAFDVVGIITESDGPVNVPSTPAGFGGRKINVTWNADDALVDWNRSASATFYEVYQRASGDDWELDAEVSAPATQYRDYSPNTLLGGFDVTSYRVRACNKAGCSKFTDAVRIH